MENADPLSRVAAAIELLPKGLQDHTQRVRGIAVEMAKRHHLDYNLVDLAALAHDLCRLLTAQELLGEMNLRGLTVDPMERELPVLLHGPVAALRLEQEFAIGMGEVLDAVRWHSTAHTDMSSIAKVVFLSDKLDPWKESRYPFHERIRELAYENLDAALLEFLEQETQRLLGAGHLVHPASIEARHQLLSNQSRMD